MENPESYGYVRQICVIGHGTIGRGTVPLIKRHFEFNKITVIDPKPLHLPDADEKVEFLKMAITHENHKTILDQIFID